jgi:hypothetical protein
VFQTGNPTRTQIHSHGPTADGPFETSTAEQAGSTPREGLGKPFAEERSTLKERAMRGVITGREVLENLGLIYREFGAACVMRCLWVLARGRSTTFLEVACQPGLKQTRYS